MKTIERLLEKKKVEISPVSSSRNKETPIFKKKRDSQYSSVKEKKKFRLDETVIQNIKTNIKAIEQMTMITPRDAGKGTHKQALQEAINTDKKNSKQIISKEIARLLEKQTKENGYLKGILSSYTYLVDSITKAMKQYLLLCKVYEFTKLVPHAIKEKEKEEAMISRILESTKITKNEFLFYVQNEDYGAYNIHIKILKECFSSFRKLSEEAFKRILNAIDMGKMESDVTLKDFCKVRYYFIDFKATQSEYIAFGKKFFDIDHKKAVTLASVHKILKMALVREGKSGAKGEALLKALIANFLLCGVISSEGKFNSDIFEDVYKSGKMDIMSFVQALLS